MDRLNNSLDIVMKNIMIRCMLNPENKHFYIGTLTTERVKQILHSFKDMDFENIFWSAFEIAQASYLNKSK